MMALLYISSPVFGVQHQVVGRAACEEDRRIGAIDRAGGVDPAFEQQAQAQLRADQVDVDLRRIDPGRRDEAGPQRIVGAARGRPHGLAFEILGRGDVGTLQADDAELRHVIHHADAGERESVARQLDHGGEVREAVVVLAERHPLAGLARAEAAVDLHVEPALAPIAELPGSEGESVAAVGNPRQAEGELGRGARAARNHQRGGHGGANGADEAAAGRLWGHVLSRVT
jgi:hypothetical protein